MRARSVGRYGVPADVLELVDTAIPKPLPGALTDLAERRTVGRVVIGLP